MVNPHSVVPVIARSEATPAKPGGRRAIAIKVQNLTATTGWGLLRSARNDSELRDLTASTRCLACV